MLLLSNFMIKHYKIFNFRFLVKRRADIGAGNIEIVNNIEKNALVIMEIVFHYKFVPAINSNIVDYIGSF